MIRIDEEFSIERDTYCWLLHQKVVTKKRDNSGEGEKVNTTYHANIKQCCMALLDRKAGQASTLREIIDIMGDIEKKIDAALAKHLAEKGE